MNKPLTEKYKRRLFFLIATLFLTVACSGERSPSSDTATAEMGLIESGVFELASLNSDDVIDLTALEGKVVYIDFWASWCAPCIYSLPKLNDLYDEYKSEGFEILSVNVDRDLEKAQEFIERYELIYPVLHDIDSDVMKGFGVTGLPTGILINASSEVVLVHQGFAEGHGEFLSARIDRELRRKKMAISKGT